MKLMVIKREKFHGRVDLWSPDTGSKSLDKERGESCQHTGGILGLPHFLYDSPQGYSWQLHKRKNHPKYALVEVQEYRELLVAAPWC